MSKRVLNKMSKSSSKKWFVLFGIIFLPLVLIGALFYLFYKGIKWFSKFLFKGASKTGSDEVDDSLCNKSKKPLNSDRGSDSGLEYSSLPVGQAHPESAGKQEIDSVSQYNFEEIFEVVKEKLDSAFKSFEVKYLQLKSRFDDVCSQDEKPQGEIFEEITEELKKIYKATAVIVHPDKIRPLLPEDISFESLNPEEKKRLEKQSTEMFEDVNGGVKELLDNISLYIEFNEEVLKFRQELERQVKNQKDEVDELRKEAKATEERLKEEAKVTRKDLTAQEKTISELSTDMQILMSGYAELMRERRKEKQPKATRSPSSSEQDGDHQDGPDSGGAAISPGF